MDEKAGPGSTVLPASSPKPPHAPYTPAERYEEFLKETVIPEPATLLDDYKGRTPEAIEKTMRSNRLTLIPEHHFQKGVVPTKEERANMNREELTRLLYQEYIKGYYRLVMGVDDGIVRVLEYLDESGLAENTLVIYTSDQGFNLGEHGFYNKQWMYEPALHQPLIVRFPGNIKAGTVHESMVNHVDMAPTLLDYAGLPIPEDIQGYSLKPILEGHIEKVRDSSYYHFYSHGDDNLPEMIGVRTATHKLIHYPAMNEPYQWEMFDLIEDPDEMNNLYANPEHQDMRKNLKQELKALADQLEDAINI
jgi:arylsulfatase A-like enzyme